MNKIFLDASYAIALSSPKDKFYKNALKLAEELEANNDIMVTTQAVIFEIGNSLSKSQYRNASVKLIESLESDPNVKIVQISEELYKRAFSLFKNRMDKEWGLTDCMSFIVMVDMKIEKALTTDIHFKQHGFQILLYD